ncbi:MAG: FN3 domain-containing metallophosphoesterase family protein [Pseudomonadota bacterium]
MINRLLACFALIGLVCSPALAHPNHAPAAPPWQFPSSWPDRIIVSPGKDPQTILTLTWRTDATVSSAIAEYTIASADSRFDIGALPKAARYERVDFSQTNYAADRGGPPNEGLGPVHYHSVTLDGLEPDTLYAYRVRGAQGHWSEWFQTRTAPTEGAVSFLYYGDAQYGILSHASRIFRQGLLSAPNARFVLHAGDLVNKGDRDLEWGEWFQASGFIHAMIPVIPVAGNHEYLETPDGGTKDGKGVLTDLWRPMFTLPVTKSLPKSLRETVFDMRISKDLHVFVLDSSSPYWNEQLDWLVATASSSDATWKVIGMHHSPYRPGLQGYVNNPDRGDFHRARQDAFIAAAERAEINLILAGHNHSYTRASLGDDVGPGLPDAQARVVLGQKREVDLVVIVSISGAMSGNMTPEHFAKNKQKFSDDISLERWATNTPTYQVVRIDGNVLNVASHLGTGEVYDAFSLTRSQDGTVTLQNLAPAFGTVRNFDTTGPYKDKADLR